MKTIDVDSRPTTNAVTFGAFRACDCSSPGDPRNERAVSYRAVMEYSGPDAVVAILAASEREGIFCALRDDDGYHHEHCFAVLDLVDDADDVIDDRCIPTREAWEWWARAVELRATSADCRVCEPAAYNACRRYAR